MGLCACLKGATKRIDALLRLMQPSTTTQNEAKGGADLPGSSFLVDLFFKAPLAQFFDAGNLEGVRFMWHERRSSWRNIWQMPKPGSALYQKHASDTAVLSRWNETAQRMKRQRDQASLPGWQAGWATTRMPDAAHVVSFSAVPCFIAALRFEMTRHWLANQTFERHRFKVKHSQHTVVQHLATALQGVSTTMRLMQRLGAAPGASQEVSTDACGPKRADGYSACALGLLWPQGGFDSFPCSSSCMLNPAYDILPRSDWVVEAGICQRPSEFTYDPASESLCCPAPDYCCPNSATDCTSAPPGGLFDASQVPSAALNTSSFRAWVESRDPTLGLQALCHVEQRDRAGTCPFALSKRSYNIIKAALENEPLRHS